MEVQTIDRDGWNKPVSDSNAEFATLSLWNRLIHAMVEIAGHVIHVQWKVFQVPYGAYGRRRLTEMPNAPVCLIQGWRSGASLGWQGHATSKSPIGCTHLWDVPSTGRLQANHPALMGASVGYSSRNICSWRTEIRKSFSVNLGEIEVQENLNS